MAISKTNTKHIFCIEGNWSNDLKDKATIKAALDFLEANADIKYIRRDCSTTEQFNNLIKTSLQKGYKKHGIIYLAFHGSPSKLHIGNRTKMSVDELAEVLNGEAKDKIIHFGSCSTLSGMTGWDLKRFLKNTGAIAVSGYTKDIDFIESTVLDILYFKRLQKYKRTPLLRTHEDMKSYYGKLVSELGFKMYF